ncbi:MAG TPA: YbgC/FadM family acyl-CoA thioesterase [Myxococcota bacterium]|nr:YbgC/FadM family acyl-CoA thioesterase [Myxococcota bacterium]
MKSHELAVRVYLEDTDAQGVVYHANYLKFFERGRDELLRAQNPNMVGTDLGENLFVVHEMNIKYLQAARLADSLIVRTICQRSSDYRLSFDQQIRRKGEDAILVKADVQVVCVDRAGNLVELPQNLFA